jgi:hypothetical protein
MNWCDDAASKLNAWPSARGWSLVEPRRLGVMCVCVLQWCTAFLQVTGEEPMVGKKKKKKKRGSATCGQIRQSLRCIASNILTIDQHGAG